MCLSLLAMYLASLPESEKMTFGYGRAEIIGALASILLIWALVAILAYDAVVRIIE